MNLTNVQQLIGQPFEARVKITAPTYNVEGKVESGIKYEARNELQGFRAIGAGTPGGAAAASPAQPAAPSQPAAPQSAPQAAPQAAAQATAVVAEAVATVDAGAAGGGAAAAAAPQQPW
ncbi:hypothetical protein D3C78_1455270 [compost metagenome]